MTETTPAQQDEAPPELETPARRRNVVLPILVSTLALALAGMTALYAVERGNRSDAEQTVTERTIALQSQEAKSTDLDSKLTAAEQKKAQLDADLQAAMKQAQDLQAKLTGTEAELSKIVGDLGGAKTAAANAKKARDALAKCLRALDRFFANPTDANLQSLDSACRAAQRYY